ncbi:MAG TPA: hypothetical protein VGX71_23820 [Pseudaminobacter sp.]|nr:hypothetical protein [Pseudaminobacter sp.]
MSTTADEQKPRKPLSKTKFAKKIGQSRRQVDKAIELGEIRTVPFAGKDWIPPSEADRIIELTK